VVADRSMEPTLVAGQGLVGLCWSRVRPGELRCVEHPDETGFWLVKRVESVGDDGTMRVMSDNTQLATVDSRRFGAVPIAGSYRVVLRVPRRWM
jgi:hypothetical protein